LAAETYDGALLGAMVRRNKAGSQIGPASKTIAARAYSGTRRTIPIQSNSNSTQF